MDSPPRTNEEMITFIKNVRDESVIAKNDINFVSQLKMFATSQLSEQWAQRLTGGMSPELFTESEVRLISPPQYSSMTPMYDDLSQSQVSDEEHGIDEFLTQINPTQTTWAPTETLLISRPTTNIDTLPTSFDSDISQDPYGCIQSYIEPSPTSPAVDENFGPKSFNHSPSILGGKPTKKRNAKRKLFLNDIV